MKIVVLDAYGLSDMDWSGISSLGELTMYDSTAPGQIAERASDCEILLTNKTPLGSDVLEKLPDARLISVLATGYNVVDTDAARRRGIDVSNVPAYSTASVAQLVFAHILEHCHNITRHADAVRAGAWAENGHFVFWNYPLTELAGKTLGIVGMGRIGRQTALLADAFGMRVLGHSRSQTDAPPVRDFAWADLPQVFAQSDFVSLHCPLTEETRELVDTPLLSLMQATTFLVNNYRGQVFN